MLLTMLLYWNNEAQEKMISSILIMMFLLLIGLVIVAFFIKSDERPVLEDVKKEVSDEEDVEIAPDAISMIDGDNDFIPRPRMKELEEIEEEQTKNESAKN